MQEIIPGFLRGVPLGEGVAEDIKGFFRIGNKSMAFWSFQRKLQFFLWLERGGVLSLII
jgi:hypothetical protein